MAANNAEPRNAWFLHGTARKPVPATITNGRGARLAMSGDSDEDDDAEPSWSPA